jgi:hypothetical protein
MRVHVLLFDAGTDSEGIHSLEIAGRTVVLLFENPEDAERYAGLLEAQIFRFQPLRAWILRMWNCSVEMPGTRHA